jgi:hypothetical protein
MSAVRSMTTQTYTIKFRDGKQCTCIAMEPATDEENIASIMLHMCGKVESVTPVRRSEDVRRTL